MIRLKDIAQKAGVSVMTVSKVLRDAPDISAGTKVRIRALAEQMGYVPDTMAQSLRTRKTKMIGLVISTLTNPVFMRATMAIEEAAFQQGYELLLFHTLNSPEREDTAVRRLLARRVDGLIIAPVYRPESTSPLYEDLRTRQIPTVLMGQHAPFCQQFVNVETNDLEASIQITRHLIELGHRGIAFFAGPSVAPWAQARLEGYRRALGEAQIPYDDHLVFKAGATIEEGEQAAQQLLAEKPRLTAILAVNDWVALGVGRVLTNHGINIPQDVSLAGFGGLLAGEFCRAPLTTMHQPKFRMGAAAMEVLLQMLRNETPQSVSIASELVVRASTAAPSANPFFGRAASKKSDVSETPDAAEPPTATEAPAS